MAPEHTRRRGRRATLDSAALERFWPEARERLLRALAALGIDEATAEDAVSEAATRALSRRLVVDDVDHFCRWAFVVARNVALDGNRRANRVVLLDSFPEQVDEYDLADHVLVRDRWRATADAITRLSATDRAALLGQLDEEPPATRKEAVRQAVRRHRARARLREAMGRLGGWLGWRRLSSRWPVPPIASWGDGWAALALLPLLALSAPAASGPDSAGGLALPESTVASAGYDAAAPPAAPVAPPSGPLRQPASAVPAATDEPVAAPAEPWRFEFTPSPSYQEDHTVFASGGRRCGGTGSCPMLYVSRDGGESWSLLPATGRYLGRILLPPAYPHDPRIFSASSIDLSVSTDGGQTFRRVVDLPLTGPAAISPRFSAGDPRIVFGSQRMQRSLALEYRDGTSAVAPLRLPLPPTAMAMELSFGPVAIGEGRLLVSTLEAPTVAGLGTDTLPVAPWTSAVYSCGSTSCTRALDLGSVITPPMVAWSPTAAGAVFVGTGFSLHRSTDAGSSFADVALPESEPPAMLVALVAGPDGRLYARMMSGGLYRSDDNGTSWLLLDRDPDSPQNLALLPDGTLLQGAPSETGCGVGVSRDGGRTWAHPCRR